MALPRIKEGTKIKDYVISKELGAGCFGRVYEAINLNNNNQTIAIKCVSKQLKQSSPKAYSLFMAEKTILSKIQNENVVGFVDYFETNQVCFLCLEYCNEGDLDQYLSTQPQKRVPEKEAVEYYRQILNGFKSLHENNILHRDLKLPNILKHDGQLKIADLGFGKELKSDNQLTATVLGTPYTMAPEILEEQPYGLSCDIYSLGVNFYQMVFGKYPFNARNEYELLQKIKAQNINLDVPGVVISNNMKDLLTRMLKYDIRQRITMQQIWDHPLIKIEQQAYQNMGMQNLHASVINFDNNRKFYQQQNPFAQNINPNQQGNNPFVPPQQQQQQQQQQEQEQVMNENYGAQNQQIFNTQVVRKEQEQAIKSTIKLYLHEINTINQIGKCVHSSHVLPETQINTFYPCFFMLKKLVHQQKTVLKDMEANRNVFSCKFPEQLFTHNLYLRIKQDLQEKLEINSMYYMARQMDMQDLMNQTPNPELIEQVEMENYAQSSERFYKQTMVNYYINLQEELNRHIRNNNLANALRFQKHIVEVLDCLDVDKFFRSQPNFNFETYDAEKESINFQQRQSMIDQKGKLVFQQ